MADQSARSLQYEYKANSNLVLQADRSLIDRRPRDEPTGEVQTLQGKMTKVTMGDRAKRTRPPQMEEKKAKRSRRDENHKTANQLQGKTLTSDRVDEYLNIEYQPTTAATRDKYELILALIEEMIGHQPPEILYGTADEVISVLKNEDGRDTRRSDVQELLGKLEDSKYQLLVNLGMKITDFTGTGVNDVDMDEIDEEIGVQVKFESDEEDEGDEDAHGEVHEDDTDDDDNNGEEAQSEMVVSANLTNAAGGINLPKSKHIHPRDIDAYWLQRKLRDSSKFNDADESRRKAQEVLDVLKNADSNQQCETELVNLLGFDLFETIIKVSCDEIYFTIPSELLLIRKQYLNC